MSTEKNLQMFSALVYICQFTAHDSITDHQNQRLLIISHFRLAASYDVAIPLDNSMFRRHVGCQRV